MIENSIEISTPHEKLKPKRVGDKAIMDVLSELRFSDTQLSQINEVRMAHRVISKQTEQRLTLLSYISLYSKGIETYIGGRLKMISIILNSIRGY